MSKRQPTQTSSLPLQHLLAAGVVVALLFAGRAAAAEDGWEWTQSAGWARLEGTAKGTPEEQFAHAEQLEERGEFYDAARQYFLLLKTYPDAEEAKEGMRRLADCLFKTENYYGSFQAIEEFIEKYPKTAHLPELMRLEYRIAKQFMEGAQVSLLDDSSSRRKSYRAAIEVLEAMVRHDDFGELADDGAYQLGLAHMELKEYRFAKVWFARLIQRFPESELVPWCRYQIALCNVPLGLGTVEEAVQRLKEVEATVATRGTGTGGQAGRPEVEKSLQHLRERQAAKMLENAVFYEKRGTPRAYDAAIFTHQEIIRRFPDTPHAKEAARRVEILKQGGRPKEGIGEMSLDVASVKEKLLFWREGEAEADPAAEAAAELEEYPEVAIEPLNPRQVKAGEVNIDLDAEAAKIRRLQNAPAAGAEEPREDAEPDLGRVDARTLGLAPAERPPESDEPEPPPLVTTPVEEPLPTPRELPAEEPAAAPAAPESPERPRAPAQVVEAGRGVVLIDIGEPIRKAPSAPPAGEAPAATAEPAGDNAREAPEETPAPVAVPDAATPPPTEDAAPREAPDEAPAEEARRNDHPAAGESAGDELAAEGATADEPAGDEAAANEPSPGRDGETATTPDAAPAPREGGEPDEPEAARSGGLGHGWSLSDEFEED
jgi:outer membrane protein assembly factor BamD (BamD/ComL family)